MADDLPAIVDAVRAGRRYRHLDPGLVTAVAARELAKGRRPEDVVKASRSVLHQAVTAYQSGGSCASSWLDVLRLEVDLRTACRRLMARHASTAERLDRLDAFYDRLRPELGRPDRILDLACGLHPLAIPWLDLPARTCYLAGEVDAALVDFLSQALSLLGVDGSALVMDLTRQAPDLEADVAFCLKALPCLEMIDPRSPERLLAGLKVRRLIVSFPVASLGGRAKGLRIHHAGRFAELATRTGWQIRELDWSDELVYICDRS